MRSANVRMQARVFPGGRPTVGWVVDMRGFWGPGGTDSGIGSQGAADSGLGEVMRGPKLPIVRPGELLQGVRSVGPCSAACRLRRTGAGGRRADG